MSQPSVFVVRHVEKGLLFPESAAVDKRTCILRWLATTDGGSWLEHGWLKAVNYGYEVVNAYLGPVYGVEEIIKLLSMENQVIFTVARIPGGVKVLGTAMGGDGMAMTKLLQPLQLSLSAAFEKRDKNGYGP